MKIIGLTGCIGTGKSTVAGFLAELGAAVIDADKLGHEAFTPGTALWRAVIDEFGRDIVADSGAIDRTRLGQKVFLDREARLKLNRLTHPAIAAMVADRLEASRRAGVKVAVLEAPLLIEAGWQRLVDEVWVTVAPEDVIISRLGRRSGLSPEETRARLRSQLSCETQARQADVVVDTDCSLDELREKIARLWAARLTGARSGGV
ncbi:MAG: dephospho-CoA kinase [Chloroflexi bacterium]|nr:dephospho-CoA kinase [Chloroflexota bacterium]